MGPAIKVLWDVVAFRLRKLEMANLAGAVAIMLVLRLPLPDMAVRALFAGLLNILVYLNTEWPEAWGGALEIWDSAITRAHHTLVPRFNRCVLFATSEISYHGVTPIRCPPELARLSFAGYYYTKEAPEGWKGQHHSTIFKARPHEVMSRSLAMPAERLGRQLASYMRQAKRKIKRRLGC